MKRLKWLFPVLVFSMFSVGSIVSCGEEEQSGMFSIETIGPTTGGSVDQIIYISDAEKRDSMATYIETNNLDDFRIRYLKYEYVDYKGDVFFSSSEPVSLSSFVSDNPVVISTVESGRYDDSGYLMVRDNDNNVVFVDTRESKTFNFGKYLHAVFWFDDSSNGHNIGQAILFRGAVTTIENGVTVLSDLSNVDFYTYDSSKSDNWEKMEGVFDELPGKEMFFEGTSNIVIKKKSITGAMNFGTIVVLIDSNGAMKYLETGNYATSGNNYRFTDISNDKLSPVFQYKNLKTATFDYEYIGEISDGTTGNYIGFSGYICAVIQSEEDASKYDLHAFIPRPSGSHTVIKDVYPGRCSVTYYSRAVSATYFELVPWIVYRSAKSELSVGSYDRNAFKFDTFVLDSGENSNWMFAEKISSISRAKTGNQEIVIFYNDYDSIKIAACNDQKKCGFDSSAQK